MTDGNYDKALGHSPPVDARHQEDRCVLPDSRVEVEIAAVRSEMSSANTQASIVLAAVAIAVGSTASHAATLFGQGRLIALTLAASGAALLVAVWLLLDVVRPRLDPSGRGSFQTWSTCAPDSIKEVLATDYLYGELIVMSRIAMAKYKNLRRAVLLIKAALSLLVTAILLSMVV
jgi:hypothetical protein